MEAATAYRETPLDREQPVSFDLDEYRRERTARLEHENAWLRSELDRLLRMLALTLEVATGKTGVQPLALLAILEAVDQVEQPIGEA